MPVTSKLLKLIFSSLPDYSENDSSIAAKSLEEGVTGALADFLIKPFPASGRELTQRDAERFCAKLDVIRQEGKAEHARLLQANTPAPNSVDSLTGSKADLLEHAREVLERHNPDSDEVLDRLSLLVRRNAEPKKLAHVGYFLARFMYEPDLTLADLHTLLDLFESLRWRQLCLTTGIHHAQALARNSRSTKQEPPPKTDREQYKFFGDRAPCFLSDRVPPASFGLDIEGLVDHHILYNAAHPENHRALHLSNVAEQLHELFALEHILFDDWAPVLLDYLYRGTTPDRATAVDLDFLRSQHP